MSMLALQDVQGKVLQGTCGWSDQSIATCGRFYPRWVKSAEDRLEVYSKHFPCVEVDSSSYAIPRPAVTQRWASRTPPQFRFHVKAFGAFCHSTCPIASLPREVKELLGDRALATGNSNGGHIAVGALPEGAEQLLWDQFHQALAPLQQASRLGCVVFQFQLNFRPSAASREHVLACRRRLRPDVPMAVEFRAREWFASPEAARHLCDWLTAAGISLIAADELLHETYQKDRAQTGLPAGQVAEVMPIALHVTQPDFFYVRLHRRYGTTQRLLPAQEIADWAQRLAQLAPAVKGPIYFLWGTDWEDAPVVNARALAQALPPGLALDYKATLAGDRRTAGLAGLWAAKAAAAGPSGGSGTVAASPGGRKVGDVGSKRPALQDGGDANDERAAKKIYEGPSRQETLQGQPTSTSLSAALPDEAADQLQLGTAGSGCSTAAPAAAAISAPVAMSSERAAVSNFSGGKAASASTPAAQARPEAQPGGKAAAGKTKSSSGSMRSIASYFTK